MAENNRPVVAMDPPHITEFASARYFEKLNQLNAQRQAPQQTIDPAQGASLLNSSQPQFILPLREVRTVEAEPTKQKQKGLFSNLRHKVSLRHGPKHTSSAEGESLPTIRASTESARKSIPLDQLFLALPNELQVQIVSSLPLPDVLNLRLTCKAWHSLVTHNESPIVRYQLETQIPPYALRLYPIAGPADATLHNLCGLWHRLHVATKLSVLMCRWITKDIWLRTTEMQRLAFAPQEERMRRRLIPLLFTLFHFFETYRKEYLQFMADNNGHGLKHEPYTLNPVEAKVMSMYDDQTLLRVHEVFPLVISSFCRRLRPPTYVGRVERSLRGYIREKPSDDVHVAILLLGGLRQVERLWETKGYNTRRVAVDNWYSGLTRDPQGEATVKPRRGLIHFGRRKSNGGERSPTRASISEHDSSMRSPKGSIDATNMGYDPHWIFNTSLSAGEPMAPLDPRDAQKLLNDLPILQQVWCTTAEALIAQRGIVRQNDIKRNQQVMLDLIREDGMNEEDEWWYGRSNAVTVQPPTAAIDDDRD